MWVVKVDDWPGMPYESWDQAHEMVWREWQRYQSNYWHMSKTLSPGEFPLMQEDKAFSLVLGENLYLVQEVEMAER